MRALIAAGAICVPFITVAVSAASHIPGQRILAEQTIYLLPAPLEAFFEQHLEAVIEHAIEPDGAWRRNRAYVNREDWHYLALDIEAADATTEARLEAAKAFPRNRTDARDLAARRKFERVGELPWQLERIARRLAVAFRHNDEDEILRLCGYVIHFCADAAFPLRCTKDVAGVTDRNPKFASAGMGDDMFPHQDVSYRIGWELIRRNAHRYQLTLSRGPGDRVLVGDVRDACFDAMIAALSDVDAMLSADANLCARMNINDAASFSARADEYYQLLDEMCGRRCVDSLRRGSALAAGVITFAWERSDASDVAMLSRAASTAPTEESPLPPADPDQSKPAASSNPNDAGGAADLVASVNSKVFHLSDCSHAKRISQKNIRRFATQQEALDSGRRPCRACHPDATD